MRDTLAGFLLVIFAFSVIEPKLPARWAAEFSAAFSEYRAALEQEGGDG